MLFHSIHGTPLACRGWLVTAASICFAAYSSLVDVSILADESADAAVVSYHRQVEPIFRTHCFGCHQNAKQSGDYLMTSFESLLSGGATGEAAIVAGDPDGSYLMDLVTPHDGVAEMPEPPREPLAQADLELIRRWIQQGAVDDSPPAAKVNFDDANPPRYQGRPTLPSMDISPDGHLVAIAGYHEVLLFDTGSRTVAGRFIGESPRLNSVRFSPDGTRLAAAGGEPGEAGELQIWDVADASLLMSCTVTFDAITGVSWSPDGSTVAIGAADNTLRAFDSGTGEQVLFQGAHEDWVRDTVFTNDGEHIVSVARDMTCKLTEVATQRFVDNVTSITPGALSGGLASVAIHPQRNEIVVGGSDGVVKVYRVFRETTRRIGDDANLIRRLPKMNGRVQQVTVDPAGRYIAAATTIDGQSEVRLWSYDFDTELTPELKKILGKRVSDRSSEERQSVEQSRNAEVRQLASWTMPNTAIYGLDVTREGDLWVVANDGHLRHFDSNGQRVDDWDLVSLIKSSTSTKMESDIPRFSASQWLAQQSDGDDLGVGSRQSDVDPADWDDWSVEPAAISLDGPYAYAQLIARATRDDGTQIDITDQLRLSDNPWVQFRSGGIIRPIAEGQGEVTVTFAGKEQQIAVECRRQSDFSVDFIRDVNPVLSRLGCNQGTCHGAQKGKNGFRLSLRGYDPIFDIRALTDDLAARRINPAAPENSLMLRKPLGISPHQGGTLMRDGDPYHAILRQWIADGSRLDTDAIRVTSIAISPINPVVESIDSTQHVRVVATYADGTTRDVTHEAAIDSGNTEVATVVDGGVLQAVRRGEAPLLARYEGNYAATTLTVMGDRDGYVSTDVEGWNRIDDLVAKKWNRMKIVPSGLCDDATFLRRIHLDLTGLPPTSDQVRAFLDDKTPTRAKRAEYIDSLIGGEDFVEYWTNKWADLLQVNRKFLGVEGSAAYRQWIRNAVAENRPYDEFAHQILTASGSTKTNPPASYYKVLRTPEDAMENTTHLFLGIRFNCNKCHDHPFERWTQDQYYEMAAFFARVDRKRDPESGKRNIGGTAVEKPTPLYEIVSDVDQGEVAHARTGRDVVPEFPYELHDDAPESDHGRQLEDQTLTSTVVSASDAGDKSRRERLAEWMTDPANPYFARSYVNRVWAYLTGVGLIEPIDDIRAGNPPTNPELLNYLTQQFILSDFDSQQLMRLICHSRTYGLSIESNPLNEDDHQNYSHATPRRLPAEVIFDAVHAVTGSISRIPGMPEGTRAAAATDSGVALADGFLANLGRPVRETACECERGDDLQLGPVMALISGPTVGSTISDPDNDLSEIVAHHENDIDVVNEIFLRALSRYPTAAELDAFGSINETMQSDHDRLMDRLVNAEDAWKQRRPELERQRKQQLASTAQAIEARKEAMKPERDKLERERQLAIKTATNRLEKQKQSIPKKVEALTKRTTDAAKANPIEWFPLKPIRATNNNEVKLTLLPDRSVLASGDAATATYDLEFETTLGSLTGIRIEALNDESLRSTGPGLAANFVVTEVTVEAGPATKAPLNKVKLVKGNADFLQSGFNIDLAIDGKVGNQNAWAVSGGIGTEHWATFQFDKPIKTTGPKRLRVRLYQNHNAKNHLLGRFRISATMTENGVPLSTSEAIGIAAASSASSRTDTQMQLLRNYVEKTDTAIAKARTSLADANKPVPPDAELVRLEARRERLKEPTPTDGSLVQLRKDAERSSEQLAQRRRTIAEDLTWALINTPAFLFNH
ncbi:MAG: DUF1549 domain-containing protein [Planctomycetota bacterium]